MRKLMMVLALLPGVMGCHGHAASSEAGVVEAGPPPPQLPAPFQAVHLGMTEGELTALFPPAEDIHKCVMGLVGGFPALPPEVPGSEKKASSRCARQELGGPTTAELVVMLAKIDDGPKGELKAVADGVGLVLAQVRGSVRAGVVDETAIVAADGGASSKAYEAASDDALALYDGAVRFVKSRRQGGRAVCAVVADDCSDLDPARVGKYVAGEYSLAQIDADAHSRVVYGKCRYPYLQHETHLQRMFVARTGGLAAIGLSRAAQADRSLKPDEPSTYATYTSRMGLSAAKAKLGVQIANGMPETIKFWTGAVTLVAPADSPSGPWGAAMVWLRDGKVVRMLIQPTKDDQIGELPSALASVYGGPGTTHGAVTTWSLPSGATARLDIGAALALVVEGATRKAP